MGFEMKKKGQVMIFVVIAILIVVGILIYFLLRSGGDMQGDNAENPKQFIDSCVSNHLKDSIKKMHENGGRVNPELFKMYDGERYNYLCYTQNDYVTCINHYPQLKLIVEREIRKDILENVANCFDSLIEDLEAKGYSVNGNFNAADLRIDISPGAVEAIMGSEIVMSKQDTQRFDLFSSRVLSSSYEILIIAREIVNQESQYCNFEYNGFMLLYPNYEIKKIDYDDSKLYWIRDRKTGEEMRLAIRGCGFPEGL